MSCFIILSTLVCFGTVGTYEIARDSPLVSEEAKVSFHPFSCVEKNLLSCIDWVYYWIDLDAPSIFLYRNLLQA